MRLRETPLHEKHVAAGARMTPFAGWSMPLNYGSQVAEHHAVRRAAGVFDVSHMTIIDLAGEQALPFLSRVFANDPAKAAPGRAVYGALLNAEGGVIDDLILYGGEGHFRLVTNAATRDRVLDWLNAHAEDFAVGLEERDDLAMVAVQGPQALPLLKTAAGVDAAPMRRFGTMPHGDWLLARTGYTGEDGVEIMLPHDQAGDLWRRLVNAGIQPAGLAARDTLRLEAGFALYGQDMDESTSALEANLGWTVAWEPPERDFIGRKALEAQRAGAGAGKPLKTLQGIALAGRGVMRAGTPVRANAGDGIVTSGSFSPSLGYSIGLARVPSGSVGECVVELRGKPVSARIVSPRGFLQQAQRNERTPE